MKSIQDYIDEALISKGTLHRAHAHEKLSYKTAKGYPLTIDWPLDEQCEDWVDMKFPKVGKYIVYYDKYHNCKHIGLFCESLQNYVYAGLYEDVDPRMIEEVFDTLEDAVVYALVNCGYDKDQLNKEILSGKFGKYDTLKGYYDHKSFIRDVLTGKYLELEPAEAPDDPKKIDKEWIKDWMSNLYDVH